MLTKSARTGVISQAFLQVSHSSGKRRKVAAGFRPLSAPMVATIHSIDEGRPAEVPLSDWREELRRLITILDRLWREADAASKPPAPLPR